MHIAILVTIQNQVNNVLDSAHSSLRCVSTQLYPGQCEVDGQLYDRLTSLEDIMVNSSDLLNEANSSLTNALAIINNQTNIIPVIQNHSATNYGLIENLNASVQNLRQKMATTRMALASVSQHN